VTSTIHYNTCQIILFFDVPQNGSEPTLPHCLHLPFCERRWTQWWWIHVCSRYWRTPTSRKVALHENFTLSIKMLMQLVWAMILQAEHFILGPCFWNEGANNRLEGHKQIISQYQYSTFTELCPSKQHKQLYTITLSRLQLKWLHRNNQQEATL